MNSPRCRSSTAVVCASAISWSRSAILGVGQDGDLGNCVCIGSQQSARSRLPELHPDRSLRSIPATWGALVDLNGQLVGITTASFNPSPQGSAAGNIGLGFAIPSNLASTVMRQLLANKGMVRRGTLMATADSTNRQVRA